MWNFPSPYFTLQTRLNKLKHTHFKTALQARQVQQVIDKPKLSVIQMRIKCTESKTAIKFKCPRRHNSLNYIENILAVNINYNKSQAAIEIKIKA